MTEPEKSAGSWGEWRLWVSNINLCTLRLDAQAGPVEVHEVQWFLAPLFRWIVDNWYPLLHEKRLPPGLQSGDTRPRSARSAYLAMIESAGDDFDRFHRWQDWAGRHSLRSAAEGGILPDIFFQRMEDEIEISWGDRTQPGADTATFLVEDGIARVSVDEAAESLYASVEWFLAIQEVQESQWGLALTKKWAEMKCQPSPALSWYLDGSPEPESLTNTFIKALERQGHQILDLAASQSNDPWMGVLSPEVAMFGDLSPNISDISATTLLAEYFDAKTDDRTAECLSRLVSEQPAWSTPSPWSNGYSLALDILDEVDPEPDSSLTRIEKILDTLGIVVKSVRLGDQGPRGVAFAGDQLRATILVNDDNPRNKSRGGRRFTLAHEFCHILFDRTRARSLAHSSTPWASPSVEQRANAFAAMLLMPPSRVRLETSSECNELKRQIDRMSKRLLVGRVALKRHLANIGQIDPDELDHLPGNQV